MLKHDNMLRMNANIEVYCCWCCCYCCWYCYTY